MMDWHARFTQQAGWTRELRLHLFGRAGLERAERVLEAGCGTGAILGGLSTPACVLGLDLDPARLAEARLHAPSAALACGDALRLPYPEAAFDVAFCHFLLLWVRDPLGALCEMKRVTRPGGAVLALAEPDYDSRVDKPDPLAPLGRWQAESLRRQGADPALGARLADLFQQAGLRLVETGTLRGSPGSSTGLGDGKRLPDAGEREMEWAVLEADLTGIVPRREIQKMKKLDEQAWQRGERVLHVPTYFAYGLV
jgi:SAM-dependent methyltransferase